LFRLFLILDFQIKTANSVNKNGDVNKDSAITDRLLVPKGQTFNLTT